MKHVVLFLFFLFFSKSLINSLSIEMEVVFIQFIENIFELFYFLYF